MCRILSLLLTLSPIRKRTPLHMTHLFLLASILYALSYIDRGYFWFKDQVSDPQIRMYSETKNRGPCSIFKWLQLGRYCTDLKSVQNLPIGNGSFFLMTSAVNYGQVMWCYLGINLYVLCRNLNHAASHKILNMHAFKSHKIHNPLKA